MNSVKKIAGLLIIIIGILAFLAAPYRAWFEIGKAYETGKQIMDNWVFWVIILMIFEPVMLGFMRFGWFAFKGDYNSEA